MSLKQLADLERKYNEYAILNEALSVSNVRDLPKSRSILTPITKEMIADYNKHLESYSQAEGTPMYQLPDIELEDVPPPIDTDRSRRQIERYRRQEVNYKNDIDYLKTEVAELTGALRDLHAGYANGEIVMTAQRYADLVHEYETELQTRLGTIDDMEFRMLNMRVTERQFMEDRAERGREQDAVRLANRNKLRAYREEANTLNQGLKLQEQGPNESNEEYAQRIENLKEIVEPARIKVNAETNVINTFKKNMKEITRDDFIIQEVLSKLGIEKAFDANKIFPALKKKILETYGYNNESINSDILVDTIQNFLHGDYKVISLGDTSVNKMLELKDPEQDESGILKYTNPITRDTLYFIKYKGEKRTAGKDSKPIAMYSETPDQGSFQRITKSNLAYVNAITGGKVEEILAKMDLDDTYRKSSGALYGDKLNKENTGPSYSVSNIAGWGIQPEKIPLKAKLGKINILPQKLFYNNILILKDNKNNNIKEIPNIKVSDKFTKLIFRILKGENISEADVAHLTTSEQTLYNLIVRIAELHKTLPHTGDKTIQKLKHELTLIEGEIEAGNDNPQLIKDAKRIVEKLYRFDIISFSDAKNYNKQFN